VDRPDPHLNFSTLFRTILIFGFVFSLLLMKEFEQWRWNLGGAIFILAGALCNILGQSI